MSATPEQLIHAMVHALEGQVSDPDRVAAQILNAFATIREPELEIEPPSLNPELIRLDRLGFGGVSVKPGNIRLNWRRLFAQVPAVNGVRS